ncbi:MAG: SCO family protein [Rhodothermales bacterium]|nr:SCO family protein [Rhodothermales bacterium]
MLPSSPCASRRGLAAFLALLFLVAACTPQRSYQVRGRIAGFGDDGRTLLVEHEDVPGFMPAMVMPFTVGDTTMLDAFEVGDAVAFRLVLVPDSSWITDLRALPDSAVAAHPAASVDPLFAESTSPLLAPGDAAPAFTLIDQDGDTLTAGSYAGQALLVTFIYTRCPLPEFCPRLSRQFATLQPQLRARYGDAVQLLSVSFDPTHDTPAVLRDYAGRYTDRLDTWTFATGTEADVAALAEPLGVFFSPTGADFDHNLATVLIGPDGRIAQLWRGTHWSPGAVLEALSALELPEAEGS